MLLLFLLYSSIPHGAAFLAFSSFLSRKTFQPCTDAVVDSENFTSIKIKDIGKVSLGPATRRGLLDKEGAEVVGAVVAGVSVVGAGVSMGSLVVGAGVTGTIVVGLGVGRGGIGVSSPEKSSSKEPESLFESELLLEVEPFPFEPLLFDFEVMALLVLIIDDFEDFRFLKVRGLDTPMILADTSLASNSSKRATTKTSIAVGLIIVLGVL